MKWDYYLCHVCPSVCLSVSCHWKYFQENWYLIFFKSVEKILVSLNLTITTGTLHEDRYTFTIISHPFFHRNKHFSDKSIAKIETHILRSITFSRKSYRLWDNVGKYGAAEQETDDNTIWRMSFACSMIKLQTHTQNM